MYLTINQHDMFRTLIMGFEIPFCAYVSGVITSTYLTEEEFEASMTDKSNLLTPSSPQFLKNVLPKAVSKHELSKMYNRFKIANASTDKIISSDIDIPMVGTLNLVTFALTDQFADLYALFASYGAYCEFAEKYRYSRNKLDHPGCRTLEDSHLMPVLSFVRDICVFLDDCYFTQKTKEQLLSEINALQQRKIGIPIEKNNFSEMPYGDSRIVCRDTEIERIKDFIYGKPEDLRKQHSLCIYGYGGIGKTVLVLETLKQIVRDIQDNTTTNEYHPQYLLFFSAKQRKLELAQETGKVIEHGMQCNFQTADELINLIRSELEIDTFRNFKEEGLIVIDNLESLPTNERQVIKTFVEKQTPSEMQFIITSRNSEEYETNFKLAGFNTYTGCVFIDSYIQENSLDIDITPEEKVKLLSLSQGNTLVLVLSLRRLSKKLATVEGLRSEFSQANAWKALKSSLAFPPSNTYEVIAEFMYKDTFENIEVTFHDNKELFYEILKVFAVIQNESTDINTICLLTNEAYPTVEAGVDILCNYLIIEKRDMQYSLNTFAEKYIVGRFLPDAETYLEQLQEDIQKRTELSSIMKDWQINTDIDRITAAKMYQMYGDVRRECNRAGKFKVSSALEDALKECDAAERLTAHPYIKYQRARILQVVDASNILENKHEETIKRSYSDCIYSIKTIQQYVGIQQTKSYASLLWLFGQYLADAKDYASSLRYLEESQISFEQQSICDQQYYQCLTRLGTVYLEYYLLDRSCRLAYLRKSRSISKILSKNWDDLGKARTYAGQLRSRLRAYGDY